MSVFEEIKLGLEQAIEYLQGRNKMQNKIRAAFDEARKNRDELKRKTYESVIAKITIAEKSGKYPLPLSDDIIVSLIQKEIKELEETQACYKEPTEVSCKIQLQIMELQQYLPQPLSPDEVMQIIRRIKDAGETNKGKTIGATVKEVGNRFDKSLISKMVTFVFEE